MGDARGGSRIAIEPRMSKAAQTVTTSLSSSEGSRSARCRLPGLLRRPPDCECADFHLGVRSSRPTLCRTIVVHIELNETISDEPQQLRVQHRQSAAHCISARILAIPSAVSFLRRGHGNGRGDGRRRRNGRHDWHGARRHRSLPLPDEEKAYPWPVELPRETPQ